MPFHVQPFTYLRHKARFLKNAGSRQERKVKKIEPLSARALDVRDYGLIESPSRIKRASRHVPLISILGQ